MDFKSRMDYRFDQLKKDVIHVLKKHPDGVPKSDIWSLVHNDTGRIISAKQYGLKKLSNVLERWTDDIKTEFSGKTPRLMLKDTSVYSNDFSKSVGNDSFASGIMAELKRRTEKAGIKIPATSTSGCNDDMQDSPDSSESDDDSDTTSEENTSNSALLVRHKCLVRQWVLDFFREEQILCCGFSKLKKYVIKRMQKHFDKTSLKTNTWKTFLYGHCKDLVRLKVTKKSIEVYLLKIDYKEGTQRKEVKEKEGQPSTAMSLLTKMSTLNRSKNSSEDAKCISLQLDENPSKQTEIIDLTNESEPSVSNSQKSGNTSKFGDFSVPFNVLQPMRVESKPIKLGESSASATFGSGVSNIRENSFLEFESSLPGIQNRIIEIINAPINTTPFPVKRIDVRQVHVPHGRLPAREYVDDIAKECIEILADANESVTMERVEQMVCQRFGCYNIRQLGFQYTDQIPCINELNRLLSKINLYVIAFVKARSICTLYELKEAIQDHEAGSADFESLRLGPLQRLPVVYQQFHFPTDHAEIPQVTTMDILDHFQNYLTKFRLWSGRLDLEPFLDYLAEEYDVPNYNMIGCKVRSLPLAATVLKKAQRDSRNQQQQIVRHFKDELKTQIGDAFRKFRASILVTGAGEGMEVRQHYMKMRPELALLEIFDKFNILFMVTQTGNRKWTRNAKFRHLIGVRKSICECILNVISEL
ncbi:uncharacterized protein LOC132722386 [Ruditapes philippinarum]|uniref:uncharacterized protein LOC132722386 n=1 Tax=Ruditapes philippinarum TaxID=129788 RepID=UPI00295BA53A|nr:uncharacterized protein LOC132722386 [Ruditapes philippinarum]XP_060562875.1 uncharacterized protein LOC132722386 [Ruditapes philippinarum]